MAYLYIAHLSNDQVTWNTCIGRTTTYACTYILNILTTLTTSSTTKATLERGCSKDSKSSVMPSPQYASKHCSIKINYDSG